MALSKSPPLAPIATPSERLRRDAPRSRASTMTRVPLGQPPAMREAPPALGQDAIHVWTVALDVADWRDALVGGGLSNDEWRRAERAPLEHVRRRFAVCRAALRAILAGDLESRPDALRFCYGPFGKPHLDPARHSEPIRFNVSHADDLALVAVSHNRELGVDLERLRPLDGIDDIARRCFGPAERRALDRAPSSSRLSTFYRYWTLKEAYLKACGTGMSGILDRIDVATAGDDPVALPDALSGAERWWSARPLDAAPGYLAALAVEGHHVTAHTLMMMSWPPRAASSQAPGAGVGDE